MVGALTLARAVDDPALAQEILTAARETFAKEPAAYRSGDNLPLPFAPHSCVA
jgi:hypothetical protein